jgi:hypothetical protein
MQQDNKIINYHRIYPQDSDKHKLTCKSQFDEILARIRPFCPLLSQRGTWRGRLHEGKPRRAKNRRLNPVGPHRQPQAPSSHRIGIRRSPRLEERDVTRSPSRRSRPIRQKAEARGVQTGEQKQRMSCNRTALDSARAQSPTTPTTRGNRAARRLLPLFAFLRRKPSSSPLSRAAPSSLS